MQVSMGCLCRRHAEHASFHVIIRAVFAVEESTLDTQTRPHAQR